MTALVIRALRLLARSANTPELHREIMAIVRALEAGDVVLRRTDDA